MNSKKYFGIKDDKKSSNIGQIWEESSNGEYFCQSKASTLTKEQIQNDVKYGFLTDDMEVALKRIPQYRILLDIIINQINELYDNKREKIFNKEEG